MKKEWFRDWFDSEYYHILYHQRNETEAQQFMSILLEKLKPRPGAMVLDLACGKGRHARFLAKSGLNVTGIDLSVASIQYARQFESDTLTFFSHDMRRPFRVNYFDYIFNFFTSFGYFDTDAEHLESLRNVQIGLRAEGIFVLDFFNADFVANTLKPHEEKTIGSTTFIIDKHIADGFVYKHISFEIPDKHLFFEEKVRMFTADELQNLMKNAGLQVLEMLGDYQLNPFQLDASPRLIMICKKLS